MTRSVEEYGAVTALLRAGLSDSAIERQIGIPRRTVFDWRSGRIPKAFSALPCGCSEHRFDELPREYVYLLGMYLGDGYLARHPRNVRKLRLSLDAKYPGIISEASDSISAVIGDRKVGVQDYGGHVEVYAYARSWPCLLPS